MWLNYTQSSPPLLPVIHSTHPHYIYDTPSHQPASRFPPPSTSSSHRTREFETHLQRSALSTDREISNIRAGTSHIAHPFQIEALLQEQRTTLRGPHHSIILKLKRAAEGH